MITLDLASIWAKWEISRLPSASGFLVSFTLGLTGVQSEDQWGRIILFCKIPKHKIYLRLLLFKGMWHDLSVGCWEEGQTWVLHTVCHKCGQHPWSGMWEQCTQGLTESLSGGACYSVTLALGAHAAPSLLAGLCAACGWPDRESREKGFGWRSEQQEQLQMLVFALFPRCGEQRAAGCQQLWN